MSDLLRDAGLAAGVDQDTIEVMREYLTSQNAYVTVNFEKQWRQEAADEKARAKEKGDALPDYHGGITRCQARSTTNTGRSYSTDRCQRKPRKVRQTTDDHGAYRGDGRLAVCIQHARTVVAPDRWVKTSHWQDKYKPDTADEVVEPEYQP
jgi:hypothetical protein